jgi:hypothetical protein
MIRGNPVFSWIPAFAGMTGYVVINEALYRIGVWNLFEFWDLGFVILKRV